MARVRRRIGTYKPRETRLCSEYVAQYFPQDLVRLRCPLGPIPKAIQEMVPGQKALTAARPWRPEVDALIIKDDKIILLECKIFKIMDGLSKLPLYRSLVPETPELQRYLDRPVEMLLVVPWTAPWIQVAAEKLGVVVDVFKPEWIAEYVEEWHRYWTREYRMARLMEKMGL